MAGLITNRVKGSTLVEVVVGMIIILIVTIGFLGSVVSIRGSFNGDFRTKTYLVFLEHFNNPDLTSRDNVSDISYDYCSVRKSLSIASGNDNLYIYKVELFSITGKLIYSQCKYYLPSDLRKGSS